MVHSMTGNTLCAAYHAEYLFQTVPKGQWHYCAKWTKNSGRSFICVEKTCTITIKKVKYQQINCKICLLNMGSMV